MAWTLLAHTIARSTNTFNVTSSPIDTTGANLIVVSFAGYDGGDVATFSDNKSNTWNATPIRNGNAARSIMYYCISPTVGTGHTFTITTPGVTGLSPTIAITAWANANTPLVFDQSLAATADGASNAFPIGPVLPALTNALLITGVVLTTPPAVGTISGFTIIDQVAQNGSAMGDAIAYATQTSPATTVNPTWNFNVGMGKSGTVVVFLDSTGTPPPPVGLISAQLPVEVLLSVEVPFSSAQLVVEVLRKYYCEPEAADISGIYFINPNKVDKHDSYYFDVDRKIPNPTIKTALIGE